MATILDDQLTLHHAVDICDLALLRAATMPDRDPFRIVGIELGRNQLVSELERAVELVWRDHPGTVPDSELESFLTELRRRSVAKLGELSTEEDFIPAAYWTEAGRNTLMEHLAEEVDSLVGGARAEGLWMAFGETDDTAPLAELIQTGILIKLRVVGAFLV